MKHWTGEYAAKGEYHKTLDPFWPYLPVYLEKVAFARKFLDRLDPSRRILDAGCGEGVLVNAYHQRGYNIIGMDLNYASRLVFKGDILCAPFDAETFDVIINLDVLEHMSFTEQERAVSEFSRILKPGGYFFVSVPNLAHLASRLSFIVRGKLIRTSDIARHPGDRPIHEFIQLLRRDFEIQQRKGFFPTFPLLSVLTVWRPSWVIGLHRLYNRFLALPGWCFLNTFICKKVS
jgi:2-polyprenyl-3-methyl-5-hydroxy-6-metoxy-1,4-benzoquinol methylase